MDCIYLSKDGKCKGAYHGFGCIKEKCRSNREPCQFNEKGFYCRKFRKFECIGPGNCGSLEDYMNFVNERKKRAQTSK
ncbi:MAG: hypothetical protein LUQ27_03835 [Methanomassiliicoccales archaeon]|nr:hypothetical protein [Methanomassiliicoccales archaeon]